MKLGLGDARLSLAPRKERVMDIEATRERVMQAIGLYSATVMVDNPAWVFDPRPAIALADEIMVLLVGDSE